MNEPEPYQLLKHRYNTDSEAIMLQKLQQELQQQQHTSADDILLYNKSFLELGQMFTQTLRIMFHELVVDTTNVKSVFWAGSRKIVLGMLCMLIAVTLFFIDISR